MTFLRLFFCLVLLNSCISTYGQTSALSDKAEISLLTCGTGDQLYSIYGHTALRIQDPEKGIDIVYNYGTFDFTTPNFYGKFIKGDLQYFVSTSTFEEFNYSYVYDNREIIEQVLNLSPAQKEQLFIELGDVLSSEKRFYTYKFIDRNCTTMVADLINSVLKTKISTKIPDTEKTYRTILYGYLNNNFYENLGINLMFGLKTDRQSDKLFLPVELKEGVSISTNNGKNLVKAEKLVYKKRETEESKSLWNNFYTFAFVMLVMAFFVFKKRAVALTYLTVTGLLGLFFASVGLYSFHQEVLWNYNVLVFNPLYILLAFFVLRKNPLWTNRITLLSFGLIAVYVMYMLNKAHLIMMLPFVVTCLTALWKVRKETLKN